MRRSSGFLVLLGALGAVACGAGFKPGSELDSLRVLAVQKDEPYAKPGDTVSLAMLWDDASPKASRPVTIAWVSGCFNPPGDEYYACFSELGANGGFGASGGGTGGSGGSSGAAGSSGAGGSGGAGFGLGNTFSVKIPNDIISSRPPPSDPKQPAYGLAYVFFAACAGKLGPAPSGQSLTFPIGCYDADGNPLGSDDFVAGYTSIYAYQKYTNKNPEVDGFMFDGKKSTPDCVGRACLTAAPASGTCGTAGALCVSSCAADGDKSCSGHAIAPIVPRSSAESDSVEVAQGQNLEEQMWIDYYVDGGSVDSPARLLNGATSGWNSDFGTTFRAPKKTGPVQIWAVVHDNRGGVNWVRQTVIVK
jgi:hypothetical protein